MASAAAGIELRACSVGVGPDAGQSAPPPRMTTAPTIRSCRTATAARMASAARRPVRWGAATATGHLVVAHVGDQPAPGAPLDERGNCVGGQVAVVDRGGYLDDRRRLDDRVHVDDRARAR